MRKIRQGVFECNSSSTHAICINKNREYDVNAINPKHIYFGHGEYGWESGSFDYCEEKASYLNEAMHCCFTAEELTEKQEHIENVLLQHGISCEFAPDRYETDYWDGNPHTFYESGYIDHGSETYSWVRDLMEDDSLLLTYLLGDALVITGNDNDEEFSSTMHDVEERVDTKWGSYNTYKDEYKEEFAPYDIWIKGN